MANSQMDLQQGKDFKKLELVLMVYSPDHLMVKYLGLTKIFNSLSQGLLLNQFDNQIQKLKQTL